MKYFIFFIGFLFLASFAGAQVTVTDDPDYNTTDASAILEVKGTSGGFLLPRMTTSQQRSIPEPAEGLVVFNTDSSYMYCFDGSVWQAAVLNPLSILLACPDSIEYSGQWYKAVQIGEQCWMAENLNYQTGTSWCYNINSSNCDTYGRLYDWATAINACPSGWHLPSDQEWKILEGYADTQYGIGDPEWDGTSWRGFDAGKRLKSTAGWNQNTGTDAFGFTALPGGARSASGSFYDLGYYGNWWSSTELGSTQAWHHGLSYERDDVRRDGNSKGYGFSVRCLKD